MPRLTLHKTSFTSGEISPRLLGRGDLSDYENGAAKLRNIFVHPTGGISRRGGLRYVDTAPGDGRLVSFEFNTEQVYLLVFTDLQVDAYRDGVKVASFATPWTEAQIKQIVWVQTADTLLVTHPDVGPRKITRTTRGIVAVLLNKQVGGAVDVAIDQVLFFCLILRIGDAVHPDVRIQGQSHYCPLFFRRA